MWVLKDAGKVFASEALTLGYAQNHQLYLDVLYSIALTFHQHIRSFYGGTCSSIIFFHFGAYFAVPMLNPLSCAMCTSNPEVF